jgi:hypothetical protein
MFTRTGCQGKYHHDMSEVKTGRSSLDATMNRGASDKGNSYSDQTNDFDNACDGSTLDATENDIQQ